jgi:RNA polymerase sigma factor (sigma-70 family)
MAAQMLFARYERHLRRVAAKSTNSRADADEAVDAARALAWSELATLRNPDRFAAWTAAIVRNCVVNEQRVRARELPVPAVPESSFEDEELGADEIRASRTRRARKAVTALSDRDRTAIEMAVVKGMPVAAVGAQLEISENAAYQLLYRARKRLRRAYLTPVLPDDASPACRQCAARFPDYLSGNASAAIFVDRHIEGCDDCRARLAEILEDAQTMKGAFGLLPPIAGLAFVLRNWWRGRRGVLIGGASAAGQHAASYALIGAGTLAICAAGFVAAEQLASGHVSQKSAPGYRTLPIGTRPTVRAATAPELVAKRERSGRKRPQANLPAFAAIPVTVTAAAPSPALRTTTPNALIPGSRVVLGQTTGTTTTKTTTAPTTTTTTTTTVSTTPTSTIATTTAPTTTSTGPGSGCLHQGPRSGCPVQQ